MRKKLTLEQAQARLAVLEARDRARDISSSFHLGRVGFRKPTKRYEQQITRGIEEAIEMANLQQRINQLTAEKNQPPASILPQTRMREKIKKPPVPRGTFILGYYYMAGCICVANEARMQNGDYQHVAQISYRGEVIRYCVKRVPAWVTAEVEAKATEQKKVYEEQQRKELITAERHRRWLLTQGYTVEQIERVKGKFNPSILE